jgi:hypothetical protein
MLECRKPYILGSSVALGRDPMDHGRPRGIERSVEKSVPNDYQLRLLRVIAGSRSNGRHPMATAGYYAQICSRCGEQECCRIASELADATQ